MSDSDKAVNELRGRMTLTRDKQKYHAERAVFHIERLQALQRTLDGYEHAIKAINDITGGTLK